MAPGFGFPAVTAAVAAKVFNKVRRFINAAIPSKLLAFYLTKLIHRKELLCHQSIMYWLAQALTGSLVRALPSIAWDE